MPRHEIHPASGRSYADLRAEALALPGQHMKTPAIAAQLGLRQSTVSKWVRHAPEHAAACVQNRALKADARRIYACGSDRLRRRLAHQGFSRDERVALLRPEAYRLVGRRLTHAEIHRPLVCAGLAALVQLGPLSLPGHLVLALAPETHRSSADARGLSLLLVMQVLGWAETAADGAWRATPAGRAVLRSGPTPRIRIHAVTTAKIHPASGRPYADLKAEARARRAARELVKSIAHDLDVPHATIVKWCKGMPEHDAATLVNTAARAERRRIYPKGHSAAERVALTRQGIPVAERARILASRSPQITEARA